MDAYLLDWVNLLLRWLHVITAIAWVGSSFYFVWLDNHLIRPKSPDLLDVEAHPTMTFRSTGVRHVRGDRFEVTGDLTIAGTTKSVVLDMVLDGVVGDPWGGTRLAFSAATEIDREEFGITWNVALETGGVLVGKKVKIELEGQAVRQ